MAKFNTELPLELMNEIERLSQNSEQMMNEMVEAAANEVYSEVDDNLSKAFKTTDSLRRGLRITKVYRVAGDDSVNIKIAFYGYDPTKRTRRYPQGVPIPLIAMAREYGTSSGEKKKPFFRKAFKRKKIEDAMQRVQDRYIKGD